MTEPIHPDDIERAAVALQALRRKYRDGGVADWDRMQAEAVLAAVGPAIYARGQRDALTEAADEIAEWSNGNRGPLSDIGVWENVERWLRARASGGDRDATPAEADAAFQRVLVDHAEALADPRMDDDPCYCGETSTRNCPVHANEDNE